MARSRPFDSVAAGMIVVPGAVCLACGAGTTWAAGRSRRRLAVVAHVVGVAWVAAAV